MAKGKIASGDLGDVLFVNMNLWIRNPKDDPPYFHLRALHSHSVDVMRHLGGDVAKFTTSFGPSASTTYTAGQVLLAPTEVTNAGRVAGGSGLVTSVAVVLAAVNIFGGFIVTQRMLQMFRKKK